MPASTRIASLGGQRSSLLLLFLFATVLIFRIEFFLRAEAGHSLAAWHDTTAVVVGTVVNDPERRESSTHLYLNVGTINTEPAAGKVLVMLPREQQVFYGERIEVRGVLQKPERFETETGRAFDYPGYLRVRGISALMRHAALREQEPAGWSVQGTLYNIKHAFEDSLEHLLPEPRAALMEGILLGERRGLPEPLTQAFIIAGLIHVVVLSGYNISIVSESVLRFFALFLSRGGALTAGGAAIVLFALMSGGGAATVRACVMGLIAVLARYLHRPSAALRTLCIAAAAMILWNPLVVLYDPGFILSVLATFGLITYSPAIEKKLSFITERFGLRSIAASTIAVQIYLLPALLYLTGVFSFVSLPANFLALPVVPLAMLFGFAAGLLGLMHPALGFLPAIGADLLLQWMALVAEVSSTLPGASVVVPVFAWWITAGVYVPLTLFGWRIYRSALPTQPN